MKNRIFTSEEEAEFFKANYVIDKAYEMQVVSWAGTTYAVVFVNTTK